MSCLGPGYNPNPTRAWSRFQAECTYIIPNQTANSAYIPIIKKIVPLEDVAHELAVINKGNILQYKDNSANITKWQKYSQIARGSWNRKKAWATQTQKYTNPNTNSFQRINYSSSVNIIPNTSQQAVEFCKNNTIPDGGSLNSRLIVNQCTGKVIQKLGNNICFPTSASDVPGRIINLCYNDNIQTWYPKQRLFMGNSSNKFPEGYKGFVSGNAIPNANKSALYS